MNTRELIGDLLCCVDCSGKQFSDISLALGQRDDALIRLLSQWAEEIGLSQQNTRDRLAVIALHQVLIHVADDLADGDADYFEYPDSQGPTTQFSLHNLAGLALAKAGLSDDLKTRFYSSLSRVGAAQHIEIATDQWTLDGSKAAAQGLNGEQFGCYLQLIAHDTNFNEAFALGCSFGISTHVARDISTRDPRYYDLEQAGRRALKQWAFDHAAIVDGFSFPSFCSQVRTYIRHLQ